MMDKNFIPLVAVFSQLKQIAAQNPHAQILYLAGLLDENDKPKHVTSTFSGEASHCIPMLVALMEHDQNVAHMFLKACEHYLKRKLAHAQE